MKLRIDHKIKPHPVGAERIYGLRSQHYYPLGKASVKII